MKLINRILSIVSAGIMAVTCSVTTFADAPYDNAVICDCNSAYMANVLYESDGIVAFENENGIFGEAVSGRRDFSMNYIILHNDGIVTAEWFGLSDEYTVKQTAYDDKTETYTVTAESYEELNKLYEASAELLEKGIIENAYKQYTYYYGCYGPGTVHITLNQADENFNLNSIKGLENFNFTQNPENPKVYSCNATAIKDAVTLLKLKETILAAENVEDFDFIYAACALAHPPRRIQIYINSCPNNIEIEPVSISGDVDMNGFVDVQDCAFIARNIAEGKTGEISKYADFNEDGKVNIRDAAALAGYFASLYGSSNY